MFLNYIITFLQVDVNEKLKNAPEDSLYYVGVIIAGFVPFLLLAGLAWFIYYRAKNRKDLDD